MSSAQVADDTSESLFEKLRNSIQKKIMIEPAGNRKLINFHFLVFWTWMVDFYLTSILLGNYRFQTGQETENNFMNHSTFYFYITII